jgi:hypothetical protein
MNPRNSGLQHSASTNYDTGISTELLENCIQYFMSEWHAQLSESLRLKGTLSVITLARFSVGPLRYRSARIGSFYLVQFVPTYKITQRE